MVPKFVCFLVPTSSTAFQSALRHILRYITPRLRHTTPHSRHTTPHSRHTTPSLRHTTPHYATKRTFLTTASRLPHAPHDCLTTASRLPHDCLTFLPTASRMPLVPLVLAFLDVSAEPRPQGEVVNFTHIHHRHRVG